MGTPTLIPLLSVHSWGVPQTRPEVVILTHIKPRGPVPNFLLPCTASSKLCQEPSVPTLPLVPPSRMSPPLSHHCFKSPRTIGNLVPCPSQPRGEGSERARGRPLGPAGAANVL